MKVLMMKVIFLGLQKAPFLQTSVSTNHWVSEEVHGAKSMMQGGMNDSIIAVVKSENESIENLKKTMSIFAEDNLVNSKMEWDREEKENQLLEDQLTKEFFGGKLYWT